MGATPGVLRVDEIAAKPPLCPPLCHLFYFLTEDCMTIEILIGLPFNQYRLVVEMIFVSTFTSKP